MTMYTSIHRIKSVVLEDVEPLTDSKTDTTVTRRLNIIHDDGHKTEITLFGTKEVLNF